MRFTLALAAAAAVVIGASAAPAEVSTNVTSPGLTCGGNCPSGDCPSCPCGTSEQVVDIATWCAQYSGWSRSCCECIVHAESGGNEKAMNYNDNGTFDVGLWQINKVNWDSCSGGAAPCDASQSLTCAIDVWKWGGGSFKLWSTCGQCGCC